MRQCSPITNEIFAYLLHNRARDGASQDSFKAVMTDFLIVIRLLGLRVAEYAQTTQNEIDVHEYPSGKRVIKALTPLDFIIHDKNNAIINEKNTATDLTVLKNVKVTFRIQKNRENGQSITLKTDNKHPEICPVRAAYRILQRAKRLGQDDDQPLGVFINHHGIKKYLTGSKIAKLLQAVAQKVHPHMTREEISRFSLHSGRVWAVVLLDEAGMPPEFIKSWLRYLSDAYRLYLRNTSVIQSKHINALNKDSDDIIKLLGENHMILPEIVPIENDMSEYTSKTRLICKGKSISLSFLTNFFLSFCMLASHVGEVALRDKLHFFTPSLLPPMAARGVHASLEVLAYARTLGVSKLYFFSPPRSLTLAE